MLWGNSKSSPGKHGRLNHKKGWNSTRQHLVNWNFTLKLLTALVALIRLTQEISENYFATTQRIPFSCVFLSWDGQSRQAPGRVKPDKKCFSTVCPVTLRRSGVHVPLFNSSGRALNSRPAERRGRGSPPCTVAGFTNACWLHASKAKSRSLDNILLWKEAAQLVLCIYGPVSWFPPTINHVNWFTDKTSVRLHSHCAVAPSVTV